MRSLFYLQSGTSFSAPNSSPFHLGSPSSDPLPYLDFPLVNPVFRVIPKN